MHCVIRTNALPDREAVLKMINQGRTKKYKKGCQNGYKEENDQKIKSKQEKDVSYRCKCIQRQM